ncbi:MAG: MATE family efflux transporter [Pseudoramibacter sp.]
MNTQENKMGTERVDSLLLKMGFPIIISMVLQAMYNIVDSMFVARMSDGGGIVHVGELAVNALTLAFPVQMLMVAFSIGTGVGVGAMLSRKLGQKDAKGVARTAGNGIFLGLVITAAFMLFGIFGSRFYLKTQTSNPVILNMGTKYLKICTLFCFGNILYGIFEKLLQSTGKSVLSTTAQISGALTNIVLDPIMIYGLLGCPAFGIAGAAYATVIGQIVSFVLALIFQITKNKEIDMGAGYLKPHAKTIGGIYQIGFSAIVMQALMSFMTYGLNIIFGSISQQMVTAYGIFYKIQQFVFFAGFGLRDAITPLTAYNYGARKKKRVMQCIRYGLIDTIVVMLIGMVILQLFAHPLAQVFGLTKITESLCVSAARIISLSFVFAGVNIALQGIFQGIECGNASLIVSLLRLLVIPLPLTWWLSRLSLPDTAVFWAFLVAEGIAAAVALVLLKWAAAHRIAPIDQK